MTITQVLVRCYPAPLRERWGAAIEEEAATSGRRAWPDLARGAVVMWLHPMWWPAPSPQVRRRRAAATAVSVAFGSWLLCYFAAERGDVLPDTVSHGWPLAAADALVLIGMLLLSPLPRCDPRALVRVVGHVTARLAAPAVLAVVVVVVAHSVTPDTVAMPARTGIVTAWWFAVTAGCIQVCRTVAGLDTVITTPPGASRLRWGVATLVAALTSLTLILFAAATAGESRAPVLLGATILALTAALISTLRDAYSQRCDRS
jgi:hypothetical protein